MTLYTTHALRDEVSKLAAYAFHRHLITGYGDGEYANQYQIVYNGKPRHFPLERARSFLRVLVQQP
jgi:hypothetical protein